MLVGGIFAYYKVISSHIDQYENPFAPANDTERNHKESL